MIFRCNLRQSIQLSAVALLLLWAAAAQAQVTDVVVAIMPACPHGIGGCWGAAYEALGRLDGVESVAHTPDAFNCMADVRLKHSGLPNLSAWEKQFKAGAFQLRGVEVTVKALVEKSGKDFCLQIPDVKERVKLVVLQNKLQWNFKKKAARQAEPDEQKAYEVLTLKRNEAKRNDFSVEVTGPLRQTDQGMVLEVREFFLLAAPANAGPKN
jgi:galactose oxidase